MTAKRLLVNEHSGLEFIVHLLEKGQANQGNQKHLQYRFLRLPASLANFLANESLKWEQMLSIFLNFLDLPDFEYCINMQYLLFSCVISYLLQFFLFFYANYMLISKRVWIILMLMILFLMPHNILNSEIFNSSGNLSKTYKSTIISCLIAFIVDDFSSEGIS